MVELKDNGFKFRLSELMLLVMNFNEITYNDIFDVLLLKKAAISVVS